MKLVATHLQPWYAAQEAAIIRGVVGRWEQQLERQPKRRSRVVSRRPVLRKQLRVHGIDVPRPREVHAYFRQHPDLAELAHALCVDARLEFGSDAELSLELYRDPEVNDCYLTLYVRQPIYETDILPRIHRLSEAHARSLARTSGQLLVTTDFRVPRNPHAF